MKFNTVNIAEMDQNCYLISTDKGAVVIDPGKATDEIKEFAVSNSNKPFAILLTHCHFDHIMGVREIKEISGGKIIVSEKDSKGLIDNDINLTNRFCIDYSPISADVMVKDGQIFAVGDIKVKVMETAGHTPGSLCYFINDWLFSGDTLFRMSVGRTDFVGGDRETQKESLKKIASINGDYEIYAGHGPATRLSYEKLYNPYIKEILK